MLRKEDKLKILRKSIIMFWALLFICSLIKLLGGNIFEIAVDSKRFISFCNIVDKYPVIHYVLNYISYLFVMVTLTKTLINFKENKYHKYIWIASCIIINSLRFINAYLGMVLDIIYLLIISYIYNHSFIKGIISNILILLFQCISLFTRNIGVHITTTNFLIEFILCIDYYIMIALYYLHNRVKKEIIKRK